MVPSPILPLAEHDEFGQNCFDASIGSEFVFIDLSMLMDVGFFQVLLTFSPVSVVLPRKKNARYMRKYTQYELFRESAAISHAR